MHTTDTVPALLAAIDGGDDVALLALADALEEEAGYCLLPEGEQLARGLRRIGDRRPFRHDTDTHPGTPEGWGWERASLGQVGACWLPPPLFDLLVGGFSIPGWPQRFYATRSAALLALAEALAE